MHSPKKYHFKKNSSNDLKYILSKHGTLPPRKIEGFYQVFGDLSRRGLSQMGAEPNGGEEGGVKISTLLEETKGKVC